MLLPCDGQTIKVCQNDSNYKDDCVISNDRFRYRPWCIYHCANAQQVAQALADAAAKGLQVRIRSGGHQHEGMCMAQDALVIDLTCIKGFEYEEDQKRVWIGSGAALADVYVDLWRYGYYFPGGACGDVHVGGLVQGGGWGLGLRKFGLTCDSLIGVEMVTADRRIVKIVSPQRAEERALLQALRGGGGGNFGVVTKFCFRLHPLKLGYTDLSLTWGDAQLPGSFLDKLLLHWMKTFPRDKDTNLTTFMRLLAGPTGAIDRLLLSGRYLGNVYEAQTVVNRLLKGQPTPRVATYTASPQRNPKQKGPLQLAAGEREELRRRLGTHPGYQPGPPSPGGTGAAPGESQDLTNTCGAGVSLRHKISSGFVKRQVNPKLVPALTDFMRKTRPVPNDLARQYVSLHCLGGAAFDEPLPSSYAFRDRIVLLQFQAWWQKDAEALDKQLIPWIEDFRTAMLPYTDGAFINFADHKIGLEEYYKDKDKWKLLRDVKKQWDPSPSVFTFGMSIPPTGE